MKIGFFHAAAVETAHVQLARILIRSARCWMPPVPIVQFTDLTTPAIADVDEVVRRPTGPIALRCLEAYASADDGEWLFVDTDVVIQRDVRWVFQSAFDIAVASREGTLRPKEVGTKFMAQMPYNKGAVFSRTPAFWSAAVEQLRAMSEKRQAWMGDQLAMNAVIASGRFEVQVLAPRYNWPPHHEDDTHDKAILHFKGPRKAWMLERAG